MCVCVCVSHKQRACVWVYVWKFICLWKVQFKLHAPQHNTIRKHSPPSHSSPSRPPICNSALASFEFEYCFFCLLQTFCLSPYLSLSPSLLSSREQQEQHRVDITLKNEPFQEHRESTLAFFLPAIVVWHGQGVPFVCVCVCVPNRLLIGALQFDSNRPKNWETQIEIAHWFDILQEHRAHATKRKRERKRNKVKLQNDWHLFEWCALKGINEWIMDELN